MHDEIPSNSIDTVVTSPPYNIQKNYGCYQDNMPREEYLRWMEKVGIEIKRVLSDNGSFFLNMGNTASDQWLAMDVTSTLRKHFILQNSIIWVKSIAISKSDAQNNSNILNDFSVGHYNPINSERFLSGCFEYIFHFTKTGKVELEKLGVGVPYQDKSNIRRHKTRRHDLRERGNVWFIPYDTIQNRKERPHPSPYPIKLPEMCLRLCRELNHQSPVLDPFCGIGSTAIACMELGVSFIGFDINRDYLDEAVSRVSMCDISRGREIGIKSNF